MAQKADEMNLDNVAGKKLAWIETLQCPSDSPGITNHEDDLHRELGFYQQALSAVRFGISAIEAAGQKFWRPDDYFAEMVKSDTHMLKIKQKLLDEKQAIKNSEEARTQRELRKFGKKVQTEKILERQKLKSEALEKINQLKRKRKDGGGAGGNMSDDEFDIALEDEDQQKQKKGKKGADKRTKKDAKFGFGGKKRFKKSNTAESTNEFDFHPKRNKTASKKAGSKKPQRPGKSKRQRSK